jgi:hypothetical protein
MFSTILQSTCQQVQLLREGLLLQYWPACQSPSRRKERKKERKEQMQEGGEEEEEEASLAIFRDI